jgi:signal peptidase II
VEAEPQPVARAGSLQWAGLVAVAVAAVVADQVTKRAIEHRLALEESHRVLPGISITHVRNSGIAFGIFPGRLGIVSILTAAAVVWMLVHFARSGSRHVLFPVALGLLVGGSVSNLADRVRDGHVTDFIHITHWPTFNLADSFIVLGVALLAIGLIRVEHRQQAARAGAGPPAPDLDGP